MLDGRALRLGERWPLYAVGALLGLLLTFKAALLVHPDLAFTYPFISYDGYQWILDGLHYRGEDVTTAWRNPALPLLMALLTTLHLDRFLPALQAALLGVLLWQLGWLLRRTFSHAVVALTLLLLFFGYSLQTFFDWVLADPWALTAQVIALRYLLEAREDSRALPKAAAWAAVSFLFQYAIGWLIPAFAVWWWVALRPAHAGDRERFLRHTGIAVAIGLAIVAPIFVYKLFHFHDPFYSAVTQFELLGLHFDGLPFYAVAFSIFFGWPVALLALHGFCKGIDRGGDAPLLWLCLLCNAVFWVLLYRWLDPRFLLYFLPSVAFALAQGLDSLGIISWLIPRRDRIPRTVVAWGALITSMLIALYPRPSPFASSILPLGPETSLSYSMEPAPGGIAGNSTISLAGLRLQHDVRPSGLDFLLHYYPGYHQFDPKLDEERREMQALSQAASDRLGRSYTLSRCGSLQADYFSSMKREITLHRRLRDCSEVADAKLYAAGDPAAGGRVLWSGKVYRLVAPAK